LRQVSVIAWRSVWFSSGRSTGAIEIQARMERLNETLDQAHRVPFRVGIDDAF
jgi:hypothetical protein